MSDSVLHNVVPLAFLVHGLGMAGGVCFVFATRSWMTRALGSGPLLFALQLFTALLWVVSGVAFIAAAWGLFTDLSWWRAAAWVAAPASAVGIALWAGEIPPGTYVGAALDVAVIVALALGY